MSILFDISHAGHVHFFKNTILMLKENEIDFHVIIKEKDSVTDLLDVLEIEYFSLGKYKSNFDKFLKIPRHSIQIRKLIKQENIRKTLGIHPVHSSIATKGLHARSVGFADSENMKEQIALYWPNCNQVFTSKAFQFRFGKKQITYKGLHEVAYLHPNYFKPDLNVISELGLSERGEPILYRMINWDATHDFSINNMRQKEIDFILKLERDHPIILSSEGKIPKQLFDIPHNFPKNKLHDILYSSKLYIGAGATTALESTLLGTPSIYTNLIKAGVLDFLSQNTQTFVQYPNFVNELSRSYELINELLTKKVKNERKRIFNSMIDVKKMIDFIALDENEKLLNLLSS